MRRIGNIHGTRQVLFNLGTFGILSRVALGCGGTSLSIVQDCLAPLVSTEKLVAFASHFTVTTPNVLDMIDVLWGQNQPWLRNPMPDSTLVISHNSYHTQVSLPPLIGDKSQAGIRHWIYLTPRSGLYPPPAPTG